MRKSDVQAGNIVALFSKINEYRQSDVYSDIEFRVQGIPFKCHRLVLGAASDVFHTMFTEQLESKESVVTLKTEITADTFEKVLEFIYMGYVSITASTNLFELFYASDFYKLPGLEEACIQHIREYSSSLLQYILQLYPFFHRASKKEAIKVLDDNIFHNFDHFSRTPEFLKISIDDLSRILNHLENHNWPVNHDFFHDAVTRRIKYTEDYSGQLMKHIDFTKLSGQYVMYMLSQLDLKSNTNVSNGTSNHFNDKNALSNAKKSRMSPILQVFAVSQYHNSAYSSDVFSGYKNFGFRKWIHSFYFKHCLPDFMRTIEVNNDLYCLSYTREADSVRGPLQKFITTSSVSLIPTSSYLTPPPFTLYNFDMCRIRENIYVYHKDAVNVVQNADISANFTNEEELKRGVYLYNTEINTWLPVPPLKIKFGNACMTSDEQRLYLIGGTNSNRYVQAYDPRTPGWTALAPTFGIFERAACCVNQKKVYVSGGCANQRQVEMYDPIAEAWTTQPNMNLNLMDHEMLVDEDGHCITYANHLMDRHALADVFSIDYSWASCMFDDLKRAAPSLDSVKIIHMSLFKPYGF